MVLPLKGKLRRPPGPKGHFLLGNLPEFRRDPLGFYTRCAREYGDIVYIRIANVNVYLINHPSYVESVLVTDSRSFIKGKVVQASRSFLGNGLLTSEGDFWLHQRRLVQPAFHRDRLAEYASIMVEHTEQMLSVWDTTGATVRDIHRDMMQLTQRIVASALFGVDISGDTADVGALLTAVWEQFVARLNTGLLIPERFPTPGNIRMHRAIRQMDDVIYRIISKHQTTQQGVNDLLTVLMQANNEQSDGTSTGGMETTQLRDEVLTLFVAGHETTAQALSWTWYLLAQHPDVEQKLVTELEHVLHGRSPSAVDIPDLKYTTMVIQESMRLYPPGWVMPRIAIRDTEIGDYFIPAGTSVTISQWVVHRDPRFFDQPEVFRPERWSSESSRQIPKFAYFPFGGGPRQCIGNAFAMMETVLLVAMVAQRYHFSLVPNQVVTLLPSITLCPKNGIKVILTRRA